MMTAPEQAQQTQGWDQMTPEQQQQVANTYNSWAGQPSDYGSQYTASQWSALTPAQQGTFSQAQQPAPSNAQSSAYNQLLQMFPNQQQFIRDQMESGLSPDNLYAQLMTPGPTNQTGPRVGTDQPTHANQPGYHQTDGGAWVLNH
jgi:hypothetical protein